MKETPSAPLLKSPSMSEPIELIGVDWGATNLRAYAIGADGVLMDRRESTAGVRTRSDGGFASALANILAGWPSAPVLMCGMIGARQGWVEAPYCITPVSAGELARTFTEAAPGIEIVCGVAQRVGGVLRDVMRGEETQVFGAVKEDATARLVCPGTHSKWVEVESGRIVALRTYLTGELFALLREHSMLGVPLHHSAFSPAPFLEGFERGLEDRALSAAIFSTRVAMLDDRMSTDETGDYLSGLLIGAEFAGATPEGDIHIIAAPSLAERYAHALRHIGARPHIVTPDKAVPRGLWRIWSNAHHERRSRALG